MSGDSCYIRAQNIEILANYAIHLQCFYTFICKAQVQPLKDTGT